MAKCGIVPDCNDCDIEHDGAEDGRCCTVLFCDLHMAAKSMFNRVRIEAKVQGLMARQYRAESRELKALGLFESGSASRRIGETYRRTFQRLLEIVKASRPKLAAVPA